MDSDFLLIQKMKSGDDTAIELFVHKYYPKILQYCHLHIRDYNDAEDLTQETFERFFRTFGEYQHYGKAVNYLYVIAANRCKDYYKSNREILVEKVPDKPMDYINDYVRRIDIENALNMLPDELREAAILFFCQEMKQKEIAKILGISLPLVKYRIRRAREQLSEYLKKEEC